MVAAPGQEIASPREQDQSRLNPGASLSVTSEFLQTYYF